MFELSRQRHNGGVFNKRAMGGFEMNKKRKRARGQCSHPSSVTVRNSGIERTVCETCGHISFRGLEGLSGKAQRRQFERDVERAGAHAK